MPVKNHPGFTGGDLQLVDNNSGSGGGVGFQVSLSGGTATVTFSSAGLTAGQLEDLVESLVYFNVSQNPTDADRVVTIIYLADNGSATPPNDNDSVLAISSTVNVEPVNDDALFVGNLDAGVTEVLGAISSGQVFVVDPDSPQTIVAQTNVSTTYGTFSIDTDGNWTYALDADDPDLDDVDDGETAQDVIQIQSADGTTQNITITIDGTDEPPPETRPIVDLDGPGGTNNYATAYTEDDSAGVAIGDVDLTISDDQDTVASVTLVITNGISGDVLFADINLFSIGFAASYNPGTYTLTLTYAGGLAFDHEFAEALTHIRYRHDGNDPTLNGALPTRSISVVANDDTQDGPAATSTVTITPLYDPPTIDLDANGNISPGTGYANTYVEGNFGVRFVDFDPLVTAEGGETVSLTFTITLTDAVAGDELFLTSGGFQGQNILMTPYNAGTGILTIYGSGTRAEWQQALGEFAFRHIGNNPTVDGTDAQRIITVTVSDTGGTGNTATTVIDDHPGRTSRR